MDKSTNVFDKELLKNIVVEKPYYMIGVDTYDKDALAYCFCRDINGNTEVLLCKTMKHRPSFEQEVRNLAKYFNADVFRRNE